MESNNQSPVLTHGHGPQQGPQGDEEGQPPETQPTGSMRDMIREVCGFTPCEQHAMELLKVSKDKHTLRFTIRRVGTQSRRGS